MNLETKLGAFVLAGVIALAVSIFTLGDFNLQSRYTINVLFNNVAGLPAKAKVKIAGVEIGSVKSITLEGNQARVTIWIRKGVRINRDAEARIVSTGIIGSKYLELTAGTCDAACAPLKDGDTLTGIDPVSLDKVIAEITGELRKLFKPLSEGGGSGMMGNLSDTLANLREVSASLRSVITDQQQRLNRILANTDRLTGNIADITSDNKDDIRTAVAEIRGAAEHLNTMLAAINRGEGAIGKLVSDPQLGDDVKVTIAELKESARQAKRVMYRVNLIETQWDYTARYDTSRGIFHSDLGFRFLPNPDKFYYLGASNLGDKLESTGDPEEKNTFNVLVGKRFGPLQVYVGAIRSKGGVGATWRPPVRWAPFHRLELTAEAYHFSREVPVRSAKYNAGARVAVKPWLNIGARVEDIAHDAAPTATVNLVFRDYDIAYLLGLVGLARP